MILGVFKERKKKEEKEIASQKPAWTRERGGGKGNRLIVVKNHSVRKLHGRSLSFFVVGPAEPESSQVMSQYLQKHDVPVHYIMSFLFA